MKKKWIFITVVFFLIAIQFWPVERTNPPVRADLQAPPEVKAVLRAGCYDCHSNETRWPWYGYVAPVSCLVAGDVLEARKELNFSEWESLTGAKRSAAAENIREEVEDGDMPLLMYRLVHPEARLAEDRKNLLLDWSRSGQQ